MKTIHFTVLGEPVPKGRPRVTRYGTYTPPRTREFETAVKQAWQKQSGEKIPREKPIHLSLTAYFPIPKSLSRKRQLELAGKFHIKQRGDLDNVVKSISDALNGSAYPDDAAICMITCVKVYGNPARCEVTLRELEGM